MGKPLSSLSLRILSSAILIPIVIALVAWGGWPFIIFVGLIIAIALYEWTNIIRHMSVALGIKALLMLAGFVYLLCSFAEMSFLREQPHGIFWTVTFMLCIWASDSVAYLFGKTMRGPRMSPTISPNKTWSGYAGALMGPALLLSAAIHILTPDFLLERTPEFTVTFLAGIAFGIAGQSGDLMVSALKRKAGLKDTGNIIPGHGGILDRIDALLLALPVFLAYIKYATE